MDSQLNFKKHMNSIQNKISKGVGILFKLSEIVLLNTLLMLYNSLILPHLTYGITVGVQRLNHISKSCNRFKTKL